MQAIWIGERLVDQGDGFAIEMPVVDTSSGAVVLLQDYFYEHLDVRGGTWMQEVAAVVEKFMSDLERSGNHKATLASSHDLAIAAEEVSHLGDLFDWVLSEHPRFSPDLSKWKGDHWSYLLAQAAYRDMKSSARSGARAREPLAVASASAERRNHERPGRWARGFSVDRLKALGLHGMAQEWAGMKRGRASPSPREVALIERLLSAETRYRAMSSAEQMLLAAGFSSDQEICRFDVDRALIPPEHVGQLLSADFTNTKVNGAIIGGPGTGKTHLATFIARNAIFRAGKRVRYYSVATLADELQRELEAGRAGAITAELKELDLVVLDGLGCDPLNETERVLLYQLLSCLHGDTSVLVTSRVEPSEWSEIFGALGVGFLGATPVLATPICAQLFATAAEREEAETFPF